MLSTTLLGALVAWAVSVRGQDTCVVDSASLGSLPIVQLFITTNVVTFPVAINQYVPSNGVFSAPGGIAVTIDNAPTQLNTVVYGTSTATNTATTTVFPADSAGNAVQVYYTYSFVYFPISISTFIQQNTVINNGGATIIINNAPTTLVTTVQGTSTVTSTVTNTVTSTTNAAPSAVILAVQDGGATVRRRQTTGQQFLDSNGDLVASCSNGVVVSLLNGLLVTSDNRQFGVDSITVVAPFVASFGAKAYQATFSLGAVLTWTKNSFTGGAAVFTVDNGQVNVRFDGVRGTDEAALVPIAASRCNNGQIDGTSSTSATSSSTGTLSTSSSTATASTSSTSTSTSSGTVSTSTGSSSTISTSTSTSTQTTSTISTVSAPTSTSTSLLATSTSTSSRSTGVTSTSTSTPSTSSSTSSSTSTSPTGAVPPPGGSIPSTSSTTTSTSSTVLSSNPQVRTCTPDSGDSAGDCPINSMDSNNCYCDQRASGQYGCDDYQSSACADSPCVSDADCAAGYACFAGALAAQCQGVSQCAPITGC